jgi:hypothetical protein
MGNFALLYKVNNMLSIKFISKNFFDVFWGEGWDNCARIKRSKNNELIIVRAYKKPPKDFIKQVMGVINETI